MPKPPEPTVRATRQGRTVASPSSRVEVAQKMTPHRKEQIVIAHVSDLHLPLPASIPTDRLLNKRILGWANAQFLRSQTHQIGPCRDLLAHLVQRRPDLVVITGDLVSLSLESEYEQASQLLQAAGLEPESTLVVPGNHDRYTPGADRRGAFEQGMRAWLPPDLQRDGWPMVLPLGPILVAGLDTAVWRGPIRAAGYLEPLQLARLDQLAGQSQAEDRHLVVAMHHPPFRLEGPLLHHYRAGLEGVERLEPLLARLPATVLCGHLHRLVRRPVGRAEAICAPSASNDSGQPDSQLGYHLYTFARTGLVEASAVRYWPARRKRQAAFEQVQLPRTAG
jgi:3',5'-cyclic AMP phosphodiesterase CpdA